jgi:polysaccharide biosynthesis transport protein
MMESKPTQRTHVEVPFSLKLADILYVLFRRKWIIAGFFLAGVLAAVGLYLMQRPLYWSEAKLLVRYVVETRSVESGIGTQVKQPDYGGDMILNSELEILTSMDLCEEVATMVGPDKIVSDAGSNAIVAAVAIYRGLTVENPRRSNIIRVRFVHKDAQTCQAVLRQLIETYFKRHKEVHRAGGAYNDVLGQEATALLGRIRTDEEELRKLKAQAGVISVEDSKKNLTDQISRIRRDLFDAEAQLAQYNALLKREPQKPTGDKLLNTTVPADRISEYKTVLGRIESLRNREFALSEQYRDDYAPLKLVRQQLAEQEKKRKAFEAESPKLADMFTGMPSASIPMPVGEPRIDPLHASALESKIGVLSNQLATVRADIGALDKLEAQIVDVERRLKLNQQNYMHIAAGLEAARFDEALGAGKMSNIQPVQTPSPPALNVSQRMKIVAGGFGGIFAAGLLLAFVLEFFVDRTVRKPGDFETKLNLPLFLSIPKMGLNGHAKMLPLPTETELAATDDRATALRATWAADHPLRPYIEGLRDRTLIHFDGDPHKPKLIGITSCSEGVGVTSLAAGLAGALSETGDGNVLLMNLNFDAQAVQPFYRGELACGITDALEVEKRHSGMVLQNLYVATAGNSSDANGQNLSKQLSRVVPKLRVSDYDYIVFDLPPATPTTMTARLAGMMDLVILVVESEKDTQESVKQASKLLAKAKAKTSAVLNKVRNPVPTWLQKSDTPIA